ncbi:hypothetical protein IAU60_004964 [Kwoniella sp. DSM 27419]
MAPSTPRPARPCLKPLTTLDEIPCMTLDAACIKSIRSYSVSSTTSTSSTSSTYSRCADDMIDRLASQDAHAVIDLWSGGNVRLNGRDLTMTSRDAGDLLEAMKADQRFAFVKLTFFDADGEDWKVSRWSESADPRQISFRRVTDTSTCAVGSDSE